MPQQKRQTTQDEGAQLPAFTTVIADGDPMVIEELKSAVSLLKETRAVQKDVGDNRDTLRLLQRRGKLTDVQAAWLAAFYPIKTKNDRRSDDEVKATRKVRAEALGVPETEVAEQGADAS